MTNPISRHDDIVTESLGAETIVYDKASHRAHSLNQTVALVWASADGKRSVDEIGEVLHRELGIPADRDVVLTALQELAEAELLEKPAETASNVMTRRQLARKLAMAGASVAVVPLVATVLAPTPAMASSVFGQPQGQECFQEIAADIEKYYQEFEDSPVAQQDLQNAITAYEKGNYNAEVQDLDGMLKALGLPPL
ncbi:MAG: PqqD family protein [Acidobacteriaceae bacterium]